MRDRPKLKNRNLSLDKSALAKRVDKNFNNKELTLFVINNTVEELLLNNCYPLPSVDSTPLDLRHKLAENMKRSLAWNIDIIFKYSDKKSPIEKIFLNSINFHFITAFMGVPVFTRPLNNAPNDLTKLIEIYEESCATSNRGDVNETIDSLYSLHENGDIDSELFEELVTHLSEQESYAERFNKYHLTPQVSFPNIKVDGSSIRVDLLVWKPSDKNFKLIVECDGWEWHKENFRPDKERDQKLYYQGFSTIRFSGSQITNEPFESSYKLVEHLCEREILSRAN